MNNFFRDKILYLRLFKKHLKDMKLKKKIKIFMFSVTVSTCLVMGIWNYRISRKAVIHTSETMTINLMKQVGLNLDERIASFSDVSYRILQTSSISGIINQSVNSKTINRANANNIFNTAILQQTSLYSYTKYALLCVNNGVIADFYRNGAKKKSKEEKLEIFNALSNYVSIGRPVNWIQYGEDVFFIRKIITSEGQDAGLMCFAMTDKFFEFIGTNQDYLTNDDVVITNNNGIILKNNIQGLSKQAVNSIRMYNSADYYVYKCNFSINGQEYMAIALNTTSENWNIISLIPYSLLLKSVNQIFETIMIVIVVVLILIVCITDILLHSITRNVDIIVNGMKNFEAGHFNIKIKPYNYDEIGMLALQMNYMGMKINTLIYQLEKEEAEKREAEYQTLQAQINPHFLYNTLGSLKWAAFRRKEQETANSIDALTALLRFTIKRAGQFMPLKDEIDYIKNYIAIEKLHYGDTFSIRYDVEPEAELWMVPGFILQPFVENALLHGLDMSKENAQIMIHASIEGIRNSKGDEELFLVLIIEDNGIGMSQDKTLEILANSHSEIKKTSGSEFSSIGMNIVNVRMNNYYGSKYRMDITSETGKGTKIQLHIPKCPEEKEK